MMSAFLQIVCVLFAIATLVLLGDKRKSGFIVGMLAQFVWVAVFVNIKAYYLIITSLIYFVLYLRGYIKWNEGD